MTRMLASAALLSLVAARDLGAHPISHGSTRTASPADVHACSISSAMSSDGSSVVARRWSQARAGLDSASRATGSVRVRLTQRSMDRFGKRVMELDTREAMTSAARPFSTRSPAVIAAEGFVENGSEDVAYYAPDVAYFVSREFADGHCLGEA